MTVKMTIILPDEMEDYERELRFFFDVMVNKLYMNRHKGMGEGLTVARGMGLLVGEVNEFFGAFKGGSQASSLDELVDVANMAWLTSLVITRATRPEFEVMRND